jgi:hypothetical protein
MSIEYNILKSGDLGRFYKYVNSKLSSKSGIAPLRDEAGNFVFENDVKAEMLNIFSGVFVLQMMVRYRQQLTCLKFTRVSLTLLFHPLTLLLA